MAVEDTSRLEQAMQAAVDAGETETASRLAEEIRIRRANGGQQAQAVQPSAPAETVDPFENIPTEIDGVTLSDELREAIRVGRTLTDPKQKRLLTARITGRLAAGEEGGGIVERITRGQFGAGLRAFTNIYGLGDVVAAASTTARSFFDDRPTDLSFGDALEVQREFRRALEEEFPITTGISEVAGSFVGGGGVGLGVKALSGASKLGKFAQAATTFTKGQKSLNVLKAASLGAIGGGITEGITEGDPIGGAKTGAAFGPLGLAAGRVINVGGAAIKTALAKPGASGIKAIAKKLGETPDELMRRFLEFTEASGKKPSIAEIANKQAVAELRDIIATRSSAVAIADEAAEAALRRRAGETAEQISGGIETTTSTARKTARDRLAKQEFAKADEDPISFTPDEVDNLLNDASLLDSLPRTLNRRIGEKIREVPEGAGLVLEGLDVNDLRLALKNRAGKGIGADRIFKDLQADVQAVGSRESANFKRAIDNFAARSRTAEGVEAGREVTRQGTSEFKAVVEGADTVGTAGIRVGIRSGLEDVAREGAGQAERLSRRLAEDSGLVERLKSVLPAREVERLQTLGRVQARSAENIATLAPGVRAEGDKAVRDAVSQAVNAIVLAGPGTSTASKVFSFSRLLNSLVPKMNKRVVENLAKDAFDPEKTEQVLEALRRVRVDEDDIVVLFASTIAGTSAAELTFRAVTGKP